MSGSEHQVISMYELASMSPNDIAEQLGYDLLAIKTTLASHSRIYRERMNQGDLACDSQGVVTQVKKEEDISDYEMSLLKQRMLDIALNDSEEQVATSFRAAKFLFNEKKGRNNVDGVKGLNVNINILNQGLQQAREAMRRVMSGDGERNKVIEA